MDITFFHTDKLSTYGRDFLVYYFEDTKNKTYVAQCVHAWQDNTVACGVQKTYQHQSRIVSFTTAYFTTTASWDYYYIMVFEEDRDQVVIIDFIRHTLVAIIIYDGHQ